MADEKTLDKPEKIDKPKKHSVDQASVEMIKKAESEGISTAFARRQAIKPCGIGAAGICCRLCNMGPCRITPKNPFGVCGADADTIAARNFARMIAAGSAAHSDHARDVAHTFLKMARGETADYEIKDSFKLLTLAQELGVDVDDRPIEKIAEDVGKICLKQFGEQEEGIVFINRAPKKRQEIWRSLGVVPRGIDVEVVDIMHRTSMGTDADMKSLMIASTRAALADGWGGSMIASDLQDIMFGTPEPVRSKVNLGVLEQDQVNVLVHGHNPLVSEMVVKVAQSPEMIEKAKAVGAKGINVAGICCTANEVLMRHGIPVAGHFTQQELAITTGAVEGMVVDVQCIMPSLPNVSDCFHTKIYTTSPQAQIPGAIHVETGAKNAEEMAKKIIQGAIENYPRRKKFQIPDDEVDLIAGFSHETINYMLGGSFRGSYRPLNDNVINGKIRGVAGVVGCSLPGVTPDSTHRELVRELIANDVLVIQSGCAAIACAKDSLLLPEAALKYAGKGLREVCEAVGIPPVLHTGACVDNSRLLIEATAMVNEGGLGDDISDLPAAGACPEWMSEKALAIGQYFVASGVYTLFGPPLQTSGSPALEELLFKGFEEIFGGKWAHTSEPAKMAPMMIDHINKKREALGIHEKKERILYDMAMRRDIEGQARPHGH